MSEFSAKSMTLRDYDQAYKRQANVRFHIANASNFLHNGT